MKFFKFSDYIRSWSVWLMGAVTVTGVVDNTGLIESLVPDQYKGLVYAVLGALGLFVRAIKQK